jgi:oxygen-independent coproporphyrinogen-3 oxidase
MITQLAHATRSGRSRILPTGSTGIGLVTTLKPLPVKTPFRDNGVLNYPPLENLKPENILTLLDVLAQEPTADPFGLYLHIPFCRFPCVECGFKLYPMRNAKDFSRCANSLAREATLFANHRAFQNRTCHAVYFGGGSPSALDLEQLENLFGHLKTLGFFQAVEEVTFECTPGTVNEEKLAGLKRLGVTRLSLGFESLDDKVLLASRRNVTVNDCLESFHQARRAKFDDIQIELVAGLAKDVEKTWLDSVAKVLELQPESISIHSVRQFARAPHQDPPCADGLLDWRPAPPLHLWIELAFRLCEGAGYRIVDAHTAVRFPERRRSVFTVENFWRGRDVLALGQSAVGYVQGMLYQNADSFSRYTEKVSSGRLAVHRALHLHPEERLRRELMLRLRTGVLDFDSFQRRHGVDLAEHFQREFKDLNAGGFLDFETDGVRLTRTGLIQLDRLLPKFFLPESRHLPRFWSSATSGEPWPRNGESPMPEVSKLSA